MPSSGSRCGMPKSESCDDKTVDRADAGEFDIEYINRSVRQVLKSKIELGLFGDPYPCFNELTRAMENIWEQ